MDIKIERMKMLISIILILISFIIPQIIYNGAIGDFAPMHMAIIHETIQYAQNSYVVDSKIPGFYDIGAIISIMTRIPTKEFLFLPIQLIPFIFIFFCLIYKMSDSYLLAGIITFIEMISEVTGTLRIFFWPHGLGYILFYTILLILLSVGLDENRFKKFKLVIIISGVSLVFISYDLHILSLIYLITGSLIFLLLSIRKKEKNDKIKYLFLTKNLFYISIVIVITQFGISNFFYDTIIPTYEDSKNIELSSLDKILLSYLHYDVQTPLKDIYLTYPTIISVMSIIKYSILFISIIILLSIMFNKLLKNREICLRDLFIVSLIFASIIYSMLRIFIGTIAMPIFYFPGIVSTVWLYRTKKFKKWAIFVILIILIMVPVYYNLNNTYNLINKDENRFLDIRYTTYWYADNKGSLLTSIASSDELTKGLSILYMSEKLTDENNSLHYDDISKNVIRLSTKDVLFLVRKENDLPLNDYFIINYNLNSMNLDNWITLKSWKFSKDKIDNNVDINKIYDISGIAIYNRKR